MISEQNIHKPVMLDEIIKFIPNKDELICFDATFGGGGYTKNFLEKKAKVYATDLDIQATNNGLKTFHDNIKNQTLILENKNYSHYINEFENNFFDYIVADLGFSSNQLEFGHRGFSYLKLEEEFDLRYNTEDKIQPAWEKLIHQKSSEDIAKIIYTFSGEKLAFRIAQRLHEITRLKFRSLKNSEQENFKVTVGEVVEAIDQAIPDMYKSKRNSILSRVWQAIRIWVNKEFENIEKFLLSACNKLKPGGRLAIVSFHSLEDKLITNFLRHTATPIEIDDFGNKKQFFNLLTKKPLLPTESETDQNPRSRSAAMRVIEKLEK